jgi:hypothetical protein
VTLGVHALDVSIVVLALGANAGGARTIGTNGATQQQAGACASAHAAMAAYGSPRNGTDGRSNGSTGESRLSSSILCSLATNLKVGILAAIPIILTETLY